MYIMSFFNPAYLITFGDILRNMSLIMLIFYAYNNSNLLFKLFLILYAISSGMIGYYAFTHNLKPRAYSEWFGGVVTLLLFIYLLNTTLNHFSKNVI